jgi:hypothetical protein
MNTKEISWEADKGKRGKLRQKKKKKSRRLARHSRHQWLCIPSLPLPSSITPKLVFTSIRSERFGAHVNVFNLGKKKRN